jgi:UTP--glucose-1-phosphate uridylyltransferase
VTDNLLNGVIAAAGSATRMWPAGKVFPKELFPLGRLPVLAWVVIELFDAGVTRIVIVTRKGGRRPIEEFLDATVPAPPNASSDRLVRRYEAAVSACEFHLIEQSGPYGNGTPLLNGLSVTGGGPCLYAFADDVVFGENTSQGLREAYLHTGCPVLAAQEVPQDQTSKFGILECVERDGIEFVSKLVEKPPPGTTSSQLAALGRYLVTEGLADALQSTRVGRGGELWLTDAITRVLQEGGAVVAHRLTGGHWYTVGDPQGYADAVQAAVKASTD